MTLIIGIFVRDNNSKKEIFFASDGLEVKYQDNKKVGQREDVEKIRKLAPRLCMGYAGKNAGFYKEVFDKLKNQTPKNIKKDLEMFKKELQKVILNSLRKNVQSPKKDRFIVVGAFGNRMVLIRASSDKNYEILEREVMPAPGIDVYIAGATDEIQEKTNSILKKRMGQIKNNDEIEKIIRDTIYEIAAQYPNDINNHIFIRRLSRNFDS